MTPRVCPRPPRRLRGAGLLAAVALAACAGDDPLAPVGAEAGAVTLAADGALSLESLGDSVVLRPSLRDTRGAAMDGARLHWSLSRTGVVAVDGDGVFRAVGNGRVTVRASLDPAATGARPAGYWAAPLADSVVIEVRQQPARLALVPVDTAFGTVGARRALRVAVTDARGHALLDGPPPLAWRSADSTVASVDGDGVVRSRRDGATEVAVTAGKLHAAVVFTVNARRPHTSCMVFTLRRQSRQSCVTLDVVMREREAGQ